MHNKFYPPLYEKQPAWREFGLKGILIFMLALVATASLIAAVSTHEAFLVFAFPVGFGTVAVLKKVR